MQVVGFDGKLEEIRDAGALRERMSRPRQTPFDGFSLHGSNGTALDVLINGAFAFVFFFPDESGDHPGFQPVGMTPPECPEMVHILQVGGSEADSFDMPAEHIVSVDVALQAAVDYFGNQTLPGGITWYEL